MAYTAFSEKLPITPVLWDTQVPFHMAGLGGSLAQWGPGVACTVLKSQLYRPVTSLAAYVLFRWEQSPQGWHLELPCRGTSGVWQLDLASIFLTGPFHLHQPWALMAVGGTAALLLDG